MEQIIQNMSDHFKLLGDKTRLTILAFLKEQELCVCDIVEMVAMSQPGISQHLRKLKSAGLVSEKRRGQWIYYSLNVQDKPHIQALLEYLPSCREQMKKFKLNSCD